MAEIDSLGSNVYFSGVQNASSEALKKNKKVKDLKSTKKSKFSDILHKSEEQESVLTANGLPPELATLSVEEGAIYLKDIVDNAGNDLSEELNQENLKKFKSAVSQFLKFVVNNNYKIKSHNQRKIVSPTGFFSNYSLPPHRKDPRYQVEVINKKLAALTTATLEGQKANLLILAQVDEIKGLIIDLMSS